MDIIGTLGSTNTTVLLILFVMFVFSMKKMLSVLINAMWIVAASAVFPIIANKLLGFPIAIDGNSILFFVTAGLGLYALYILAASIYKVLGIFEKGGAEIVRPIRSGITRRRDSMEKRAHDFVDEKKKR